MNLIRLQWSTSLYLPFSTNLGCVLFLFNLLTIVYPGVHRAYPRMMLLLIWFQFWWNRQKFSKIFFILRWQSSTSFDNLFMNGAFEINQRSKMVAKNYQRMKRVNTCYCRMFEWFRIFFYSTLFRPRCAPIPLGHSDRIWVTICSY